MKPYILSPKNRYQQLLFSNQNEIDDALRFGRFSPNVLKNTKVSWAYAKTRPMPDIDTSVGLTVIGKKIPELFSALSNDGTFHRLMCDDTEIFLFACKNHRSCLDQGSSQITYGSSGNILVIDEPVFKDNVLKDELVYYEINKPRLFISPRGKEILSRINLKGIDILVPSFI